jgi:ribosomal protein S18 acetylase RimI-like enzyme
MASAEKNVVSCLVGVKTLQSYLERNKHISEQANNMLSYFPMFNENIGGEKYTIQLLDKQWDRWEKILHTVIIINGQNLIGFGQILINNGHSEIFNVVINRNFRKKGFGKTLVNQLEKIAYSTGCTVIFLWCEHYIRPFYSNMNYKYNGKEKTVHGFRLYQMIMKQEIM